MAPEVAFPGHSIIRAKRVEHRIHTIRSHKVMLDWDLAFLYGVQTKTLNRAVKRNRDRFPQDFMFRLTRDELENLRFQNGTSRGWGGRRHLPYAFTEHGVAMLSGVLRSRRAVRVNIEIMRAFVRLRRLAVSYEDLETKIEALEQKYDAQFRVVFDAIRELMEPPENPLLPIGFRPTSIASAETDLALRQQGPLANGGDDRPATLH